MNHVAALGYLEWRMAVNKFRRVLRQPGRLVLWILFLAWFSVFLATRMSHTPGSQYALLMPDSAHLFYAFVPALYLVILGMQIRAGCRRPPATFAYPADARFLFGSRLPHRLVMFWLQLREAAFSGSRLFLGLFFLSWNFATSAGGLFLATVALLAAYIIGFGIRLPVFLAQRRLPNVPFAWVGGALVASGAVAILYPIVVAIVSNQVHLRFIAALVPTMTPGSWIVQALNGDLPALLLLLMLASLVVFAGSVAASDAYPEIWEASSRLYAMRALAASGRGLWNREAWRKLREADPDKPAARVKSVESVSGDRAPVGALTVFWKEWIALRRSPGGLRWPLFWAIGACVFGYLAGIATENLSFFVLLGPLVAIANIIIVIGSQSTISLSNEIRRPIWWLGHSELRTRMLAWILSTTLRVGPPLVAGTVVAGVAMHSWIMAVAAAPIIVVSLFLIQSIGVASYVVLPGRNDLRGPGFMLRIFTTYLLLGPPAVVWTLAQVISGSPLVGITTGLIIAAAEGWVLVSFAASRLEQNAMAYATAEER